MLLLFSAAVSAIVVVVSALINIFTRVLKVQHTAAVEAVVGNCPAKEENLKGQPETTSSLGRI